MPTTLDKPQVARALQKLHAAAATEDGAAKQRVLARETELGRRLDQAERYEIYGDAPLAIQPQVGRLLYVLAVSRRARAVVEFGASRGVSTLYLAAALKDAGGGSLVTTELRADKARATREALVDAGLDDLVELRVGDALETLRDLERDITSCFSTAETTCTCRFCGSSSPDSSAARSSSATSTSTIRTCCRTWATSASRAATTCLSRSRWTPAWSFRCEARASRRGHLVG